MSEAVANQGPPQAQAPVQPPVQAPVQAPVQPAAPDPAQVMRDRYFAMMGVGPLTREQIERLDERVDLATIGTLTDKAQQRLDKLDKLTRKELAAKAKTDRALGKSDAGAEKERLLYEDRLTRARITLEALRDYAPASDAAVLKLEDGLAAAAGLALDRRFADARKTLDKSVSKDAVGSADKAFEGARKSGRKAHPDAFATLDAVDALLDSPDTPLPRNVLDRIRAGRDEAERPLLATGAADADVAAAAKRLRVMREDLQADIDAAQDEAREVRMLRGDALVLHDLVTKPGKGVPPILNERQAAVMLHRIEQAQTATAAHDLEAAREMLQGVIDGATAARDTVAADRLRWEATSAHVATHLRLVEALAQSATAPGVKEDATALADNLREIGELGPGDGMTYGEALDRVSEAARRRPELEKQDAAFKAFRAGAAPQRGRWTDSDDDGDEADDEAEDDGKGPVAPLAAAEGRIAAKFKAVAKLLSGLHRKVEDATGDRYRTVADGPFLLRRDEAAATWKTRVAGATDEGTLDEAGVAVALDALAADIRLVTKTPALLDDAIEDGRLARAQAACAETRRIAVEGAETLLMLDAARGAADLARIEAICDEAADSATPKAFRKAMVKLAALAAESKSVGDEAGTAVAELQAHLQAMLERIGTQFDGLQTLVDKARTGKAQGERNTLLDTMRTTYDGLRATAKLTQVDALRAAIGEADEFEEELEASTLAAGGKAEGGEDGTTTFDGARKSLANMRKTLGKDVIKTYATVTAFDLTEAAAELEKGFGGTSMTALAKGVRDLGEKVSAAKTQAEDAKTLFKAFEEDLDTMGKKLDAPGFKDAPAYRKAVQARLKALAGDGRFEGGVKDAKSRALLLSDELDAALAGPTDASGRPQALTDHEAASVAAADAALADEKRFTAQAEILRKRLDEAKTLNPREISPLIDSLKTAKKAADKSKDFAAGREQLSAIRKRLGLVAANPGGLAITARNKLPAVMARLRNAVTNLGRGTEAVEKAVLALPVTDLDNAGRQAVTSQLAAVRALFNPALLDAPVAKMIAKDAADPVRSAQREVALRAVRQMGADVNNDFRLRVLAQTPFVGGMDAAVSELALSLLDLENNLLVSL